MFKDDHEPTVSNFYSQAAFDDLLPCSQDANAYLKYQNEYLNPNQDISLQNASKRTKKTRNVKHKTRDNGLNSYIIKKIKKGRRIIKISISNLELGNGSKEIEVQYVVEDEFDEMLNSTEELVNKIVKKLSNVSY
jgi:hypothetical protein